MHLHQAVYQAGREEQSQGAASLVAEATDPGGGARPLGEAAALLTRS
jgi:hypothetical protein